MIRVLFVGDGPRDAACLPPLVIVAVKMTIESHFRAWRDFRVGGYERKVLFAIRVARDEKLAGLVAVVDSDKERPRDRLRKLRAGREKDRVRSAPLPTALGEARPHVEAWLLDDVAALREVLQLPAETKVPTIRQVQGNPKAAIEKLVSTVMTLNAAEDAANETSFLTALEVIAERLDQARCTHAKETGFEEFLEDLRHEFRILESGG